VVPNEGRTWFTQKKDSSALYAILDSETMWERGTWREFTLHSVRASTAPTISVLGQNDRTVEYRPELTPKSSFVQESDGLHIRVMRAQRLQDNSRWPNAMVVKLTGVEPALSPPKVVTSGYLKSTGGTITLKGNLASMGDVAELQVAFEYRPLSGEDTNARSGAWIATTVRTIKQPGEFSIELHGLAEGIYEFHAVAKHPLLDLYGDEMTVR
jgi:alpha-L-fucosidase